MNFIKRKFQIISCFHNNVIIKFFLMIFIFIRRNNFFTNLFSNKLNSSYCLNKLFKFEINSEIIKL